MLLPGLGKRSILDVLEHLADLGFRVHHKGTVGDNGFADGQPGHKNKAHAWASVNHNLVSVAKDQHPYRLGMRAAEISRALEYVGIGCVSRRNRQRKIRAWRHGYIHVQRLGCDFGNGTFYTRVFTSY